MRACLPAATGAASSGCWWGDEGYEKLKFIHTPHGAIFPLGHPEMAPLQARGDPLPHLCSSHSPWEPLRTPLYSLPRLALSSACPGSARTQVGLPRSREGLILFVCFFNLYCGLTLHCAIPGSGGPWLYLRVALATPHPLLSLSLYPIICSPLTGFIFSGQRPGPVTLDILLSSSLSDCPSGPTPSSSSSSSRLKSSI